jgi:carboxymethylenebutenolidase
MMSIDGLDAEVRSLLPPTDFSRRGFLTTTLIAGFTLATGPVNAQSVITTDASGLTAGEIKIPVPDGQMPAYRAMPAAAGPFPTVLVVQEIFGVHEHIKDVCRRFAKLGYYAVAPELFARAADISKLSTIDEGRAAAAKVSDRQVMADLDAAAAFAKVERGDTTRLGITGFCWGGRIVWLYSAHSPQLRAGVAWYGRLTGPTNEMQPQHPLDLVDSLKAPVLGLYGGADQGIPNADVEKMRAALKKAAKPSEIMLYDGAPHGFHADYRPSYREASAKDGWQRLQNWFQKHGAA